MLTPNERRVAGDRRDCSWLYVVTDCATKPTLQEPVKDPGQFTWHKVTKMAHYWLEVEAMTRLMRGGSLVNRTPVRSSNIRSIGYEPDAMTLEVEFHSGGIYQYSSVPESIYQGIMRAASKGSYFHDHIKDR